MISDEKLYELYLTCNMQVCTDTRKIGAGQMFFALKGERFNANRFAVKALESGAYFAVVDEPVSDDERIILVDDVLGALQRLSTFHRRIIRPRLLAVGGSNGKTTTKELLVATLNRQYKVLATKGNFNNHIGVPLTLLELRKEHQIAIVEMGANKEGDIRELCQIAEPELGLITNIGKEHLEGFGDMEGVARAESELFEYLRTHEGHAFVNADDPWLQKMGDKLKNKTEYGEGDGRINMQATIPGIKFNYKGMEVRSSLMGPHNMQNIRATIAVCEFFRMEPSDIAAGISTYIPGNNRTQWVNTDRGNHVLLDAYNANPSSVEAIVQAFSELDGTKIVLLGDMFELGKWEREEHRKIASLCENLNLNDVCLIGKAFSNAAESKGNIHVFREKPDAAQWLATKKLSGVKVLIKGSRGMEMESLLDLF